MFAQVVTPPCLEPSVLVVHVINTTLSWPLAGQNPRLVVRVLWLTVIETVTTTMLPHVLPLDGGYTAEH